ncbi:sensor histidine kinase [Streptomyces oceani]|uniref:Signal transduction histidine kinase subgroup 3 dimerisation and phosphoacceptor domain-containing protein n=1 Tax=Streptomyces oceani TaxID=1075402 RepID=A0A1E7JWD7_9ACTN|nr:histidine kinase [Streptomyces oceani]OEU95958.1 hypothetical protein AN216_22745 [Streptomyces oceani]
MSPWKLTDWWSRHSDPSRIELYTRWTFYSFGLVEMVWLTVLTTGSEVPTVAQVLLVALIIPHGLYVILCSGRALDWALDRRGRPTAEFVASAALGLAYALSALGLWALGELSHEDTALKVMLPLVFGIMPVAVSLRPGRIPHLVAGTAATPVVCGLVFGLPQHTTYGMGLGTLIFAGGMVSTMRLSTWMVRVVWELDVARETQARLAVAEERLRFSRDLHDVLGRNLSVVALKSELAVQLAQRGVEGQRGAMTQMAEVQRIARDSQREVREVVRGYREAGLDTELAGARGVLASAGIECEISTEGVGELPHSVQSVLGWVVREGTTNVLRHTEAANCGIRLSVDRERGRAVLVLANNGATRASVDAASVDAALADGADEREPDQDQEHGRDGGSGLRGLRERLAAVDGSVVTEHGADGTFRLTAQVPLSSETRSERKAVRT